MREHRSPVGENCIKALLYIYLCWFFFLVSFESSRGGVMVIRYMYRYMCMCLFIYQWFGIGRCYILQTSKTTTPVQSFKENGKLNISAIANPLSFYSESEYVFFFCRIDVCVYMSTLEMPKEKEEKNLISFLPRRKRRWELRRVLLGDVYKKKYDSWEYGSEYRLGRLWKDYFSDRDICLIIFLGEDEYINIYWL